MSKQKALFLDLDGTIIETKSGKVFPINKYDWKFIEGVPEKIKEFSDNGFLIFIITNQGGVQFVNKKIGKTYTTRRNIISKLEDIIEELNNKGCKVEDYRISWSIKETCRTRKPHTGMYESIRLEYGLINETISYMVGDLLSDEEFASNCNLNFIWAKDFINFKLK